MVDHQPHVKWVELHMFMSIWRNLEIFPISISSPPNGQLFHVDHVHRGFSGDPKDTDRSYLM